MPSSAAISNTTARVMPRNAPAVIGRREDLAALDDENIVRRAFGDVPGVVQHERFIRAGQIRLDPRHHVVQIIQRFDRRI